MPIMRDSFIKRNRLRGMFKETTKMKFFLIFLSILVVVIAIVTYRASQNITTEDKECYTVYLPESPDAVEPIITKVECRESIN